MYLKDRADKDGQCYPAIGTIAKDLKLSRSTVQRAIADLVRSGRLRKEQRWRENGGRSSLLYTLQ
jgi:predicted transcriptional regulator